MDFLGQICFKLLKGSNFELQNCNIHKRKGILIFISYIIAENCANDVVQDAISWWIKDWNEWFKPMIGLNADLGYNWAIKLEWQKGRKHDIELI